MEVTRQICTFYMDNVLFGIDTKFIQEVLRSQIMTPVPLSPPSVKGLVNLRGQIVTGINLRYRLGLDDSEHERPPMNIVVRTNGEIASLLVDEIGDVIEVSDELYECVPENLQDDAREFILGAYKLEDQLLLLIDAEKTVNLDYQTEIRNQG